MDREESILEALEDDEFLLGDISDVDMIDAELSDTEGGDGAQSEATKNTIVADAGEEKDVKAAGYICDSVGVGCTNNARNRKKKKRRNRREKAGGSDYSFASINRFVYQICRHLKEKKQHLLWSAVSCLGVSTIRDLVKEVDAIQACGGQQIADGSRSRTGGGVLWNILKTREPKAYKEIMAKGREFEKQFRPGQIQKAMKEKDNFLKMMNDKDKVNPPKSYGFSNGNSQPSLIQRTDIEVHQVQCNNTHMQLAMDRIQIPVCYYNLSEKGEIHIAMEKDEAQEVMNGKDKVNLEKVNGCTDANSQHSVIQHDTGVHQIQSTTQRAPALERIRRPVSYDDLFEEGEIH